MSVFTVAIAALVAVATVNTDAAVTTQSLQGMTEQQVDCIKNWQPHCPKRPTPTVDCVNNWQPHVCPRRFKNTPMTEQQVDCVNDWQPHCPKRPHLTRPVTEGVAALAPGFVLSPTPPSKEQFTDCFTNCIPHCPRCFGNVEGLDGFLNHFVNENKKSNPTL